MTLLRQHIQSQNSVCVGKILFEKAIFILKPFSLFFFLNNKKITRQDKFSCFIVTVISDLILWFCFIFLFQQQQKKTCLQGKKKGGGEKERSGHSGIFLPTISSIPGILVPKIFKYDFCRLNIQLTDRLLRIILIFCLGIFHVFLMSASQIKEFRVYLSGNIC